MKFLFRAIFWPIKKILLFPIKLLIFITFLLVAIIFFLQYRMDFETDVSPLRGYEVEACIQIIENNDMDPIIAISNFSESFTKEEREVLKGRLPDRLKPLMEPEKINDIDYDSLKNSLKFYLQLGRIPGFNNKALSPQAASLCRSALS
tara:strand:+ start:391 stop:834 length:444 start_codon:yes stop_codon:yes gene_type:complete